MKFVVRPAQADDVPTVKLHSFFGFPIQGKRAAPSRKSAAYSALLEVVHRVERGRIGFQLADLLLDERAARRGGGRSALTRHRRESKNRGP